MEGAFSEVYPFLDIYVPRIRKLGDTPMHLLCLSLHLCPSTRTGERGDGCTPLRPRLLGGPWQGGAGRVRRRSDFGEGFR